MDTLSNNLKKYRVSNKFTQEEISKVLNISQRAYSFYETGRSKPSIDILIELANLYEISLDILVGRYIINK